MIEGGKMERSIINRFIQERNQKTSQYSVKMIRIVTQDRKQIQIALSNCSFVEMMDGKSYIYGKVYEPILH